MEDLPSAPPSPRRPHERLSLRLVVRLQRWDDDFLDVMQATWPQALQRLKTLPETPA